MEHYDWNDGWLFCPTFDPALVRPECTGLELESVRIPHTVKALPYNYCNENDHQRLCGYRREFFAPAEWAGRTVLLTFGAIAHDATVFCNGRRLFHHGCGYTAFTVDLTSALHLGKKNVVAVRCLLCGGPEPRYVRFQHHRPPEEDREPAGKPQVR